MASVEKKSIKEWEAELEERGLLETVRQACRRHGITFAEFFGGSRTRSVVHCRREVVQTLHEAKKTTVEIGRWLGLDPSGVAYHLSQSKKARRAAA